jgi:arginyl-tRNA--protein-N-Asp/Glu arginylyltransferase
MNYFDTPLQYYKNLCNDITNYAYKGRCYNKCPDDYIGVGLNCVLKDNISQINSFFDPNSNYCNQVCTASMEDISAYDPIIQKSCWCKSIGCDKCSDYSISNCNC